MFRNSGKSPLIVFEDADLQKAAKVAAFSIVFNSGQVCMASSRVYVQKSVADEFTKLYAQAIQAVAGQAGNPLPAMRAALFTETVKPADLIGCGGPCATPAPHPDGKTVFGKTVEYREWYYEGYKGPREPSVAR